jgi:hypothetical protein
MFLAVEKDLAKGMDVALNQHKHERGILDYLIVVWRGARHAGRNAASLGVVSRIVLGPLLG